MKETLVSEVWVKVESGAGLHGADVHEITTLVKTFLRLLPEPLLPCLFHDPLLSSMALEEPDKRVEAVQGLCFSLPAPHLSCLRYFMKLLHNIASHVAENKMSPRNLAVVLTPSIIRLKARTKLMTKEEMRALPLQTALVEHLIWHADAIGAMTSQLHQNTERLLRKKLGKNKKKKKGKTSRDPEERVAVASAALGVVANLHFRPNTSDTVSDTYLVDGPHMQATSGTASGKKSHKSGKHKKRVQSVSLARGSSSVGRASSVGRTSSVGRASSQQRRRRSRSTKPRRKNRRRSTRPLGQLVNSVSMKSPVVQAWSSTIPFLDGSEEDAYSCTSSDSDWSHEESYHSGVETEDRKSSSQTQENITNLSSTQPLEEPKREAVKGTKRDQLAKTGVSLKPKGRISRLPQSASAQSLKSTLSQKRTEAASNLTVSSLHDLHASRRCTASEPIHSFARKLLNDRGSTGPSASGLSRCKKANSLPRQSEKFKVRGLIKTNLNENDEGAIKTPSSYSTADVQISRSAKASADSTIDEKDKNKPEGKDSDNQNLLSKEPSHPSKEPGGKKQDSVQLQKDLPVPDEREHSIINKSNMPSNGNDLDSSFELEASTMQQNRKLSSYDRNESDEPLAANDTNIPERDTAARDARPREEDEDQQQCLANNFLSACLRRHFDPDSPPSVGRTQPAGKLKKRLLQADKKCNSRSKQEQPERNNENTKTVTPTQMLQESQQPELEGNPTSFSRENIADSVPQNAVAQPQSPTAPASIQKENFSTEECPSQTPTPLLSSVRDRQRRLSYGMEKMPQHFFQRVYDDFPSPTPELDRQRRLSCGVERISPHILEHFEKERMVKINHKQPEQLHNIEIPPNNTSACFKNRFLPAARQQENPPYNLERIRIPQHIAEHIESERMLETDWQHRTTDFGTESRMASHLQNSFHDDDNRRENVLGSMEGIPVPAHIAQLENEDPVSSFNGVSDQLQKEHGPRRILPTEIHPQVEQYPPSEMLDSHLQRKTYGSKESPRNVGLVQTEQSRLAYNRQRRLSCGMEPIARPTHQQLQREQSLSAHNRQRRLSCGKEASTPHHELERIPETSNQQENIPSSQRVRSIMAASRQRRLSFGMEQMQPNVIQLRNERMTDSRNRERRLTCGMDRLPQSTYPTYASDHSSTISPQRDMYFVAERQPQMDPYAYNRLSKSQPSRRLSYGFESLSPRLNQFHPNDAIPEDPGLEEHNFPPENVIGAHYGQPSQAFQEEQIQEVYDDCVPSSPAANRPFSQDPQVQYFSGEECPQSQWTEAPFTNPRYQCTENLPDTRVNDESDETCGYDADTQYDAQGERMTEAWAERNGEPYGDHERQWEMWNESDSGMDMQQYEYYPNQERYSYNQSSCREREVNRECDNNGMFLDEDRRGSSVSMKSRPFYDGRLSGQQRGEYETTYDQQGSGYRTTHKLQRGKIDGAFASHPQILQANTNVNPMASVAPGLTTAVPYIYRMSGTKQLASPQEGDRFDPNLNEATQAAEQTRMNMASNYCVVDQDSPHKHEQTRHLSEPNRRRNLELRNSTLGQNRTESLTHGSDSGRQERSFSTEVVCRANEDAFTSQEKENTYCENTPSSTQTFSNGKEIIEEGQKGGTRKNRNHDNENGEHRNKKIDPLNNSLRIGTISYGEAGALVHTTRNMEKHVQSTVEGFTRPKNKEEKINTEYFEGDQNNDIIVKDEQNVVGHDLEEYAISRINRKAYFADNVTSQMDHDRAISKNQTAREKTQTSTDKSNTCQYGVAYTDDFPNVIENLQTRVRRREGASSTRIKPDSANEYTHGSRHRSSITNMENTNQVIEVCTEREEEDTTIHPDTLDRHNAEAPIQLTDCKNENMETAFHVAARPDSLAKADVPCSVDSNGIPLAPRLTGVRSTNTSKVEILSSVNSNGVPLNPRMAGARPASTSKVKMLNLVDSNGVPLDPRTVGERPFSAGKVEMLSLVDSHGVPVDPRMVGIKPPPTRKHRRTSPVSRTAKVNSGTASPHRASRGEHDMEYLQHELQRMTIAGTPARQHQQDPRQIGHPKLPEGGDVVDGLTSKMMVYPPEENYFSRSPTNHGYPSIHPVTQGSGLSESCHTAFPHTPITASAATPDPANISCTANTNSSNTSAIYFNTVLIDTPAVSFLVCHKNSGSSSQMMKDDGVSDNQLPPPHAPTMQLPPPRPRFANDLEPPGAIDCHQNRNRSWPPEIGGDCFDVSTGTREKNETSALPGADKGGHYLQMALEKGPAPLAQITTRAPGDGWSFSRQPEVGKNLPRKACFEPEGDITLK
ncbi:uncharacterized protein [Littorina saxatilis]|uniref:uncharacterized protein n=1 Tax=Littorina saxatilis TaxID=31220 RepID=UPI0038B4E724